MFGLLCYQAANTGAISSFEENLLLAQETVKSKSKARRRDLLEPRTETKVSHSGRASVLKFSKPNAFPKKGFLSRLLLLLAVINRSYLYQFDLSQE